MHKYTKVRKSSNYHSWGNADGKALSAMRQSVSEIKKKGSKCFANMTRVTRERMVGAMP